MRKTATQLLFVVDVKKSYSARSLVTTSPGN